VAEEAVIERSGNFETRKAIRKRAVIGLLLITLAAVRLDLQPGAVLPALPDCRPSFVSLRAGFPLLSGRFAGSSLSVAVLLCSTVLPGRVEKILWRLWPALHSWLLHG